MQDQGKLPACQSKNTVGPIEASLKRTCFIALSVAYHFHCSVVKICFILLVHCTRCYIASRSDKWKAWGLNLMLLHWGVVRLSLWNRTVIMVGYTVIMVELHVIMMGLHGYLARLKNLLFYILFLLLTS